jgi:hypothetical protein
LFLKLQSVADNPINQPARRIPAQSPKSDVIVLRCVQTHYLDGAGEVMRR